jgi:hypothetical protein
MNCVRIDSQYTAAWESLVPRTQNHNMSARVLHAHGVVSLTGYVIGRSAMFRSAREEQRGHSGWFAGVLCVVCLNRRVCGVFGLCSQNLHIKQLAVCIVNASPLISGM